MPKPPTLQRRELLDSFAGRFDADSIDLNDQEDVMFLAEVVALDLLELGLAPAEICEPLQEALRVWTPEAINEFTAASNVNWEFSDEVEEMLKAVINRIILTAHGGGTLARTVSREEYLRMHAAGLPDRQEPGPG